MADYVSYLDLAGRFRRRPDQSEETHSARAASSSTIRSLRWPPGVDTMTAGRRGERGPRVVEERARHRGRRDGSEHVRPDSRGTWGDERWTGWWARTLATTTPCSFSPTIRESRGDGGRDHVPLRHRRNRGRVEQAREPPAADVILGRSPGRAAVPGRRAARRTWAPRRPVLLGDGLPFDNLRDAEVQLEQVRPSSASRHPP